MMSKMGMNPNGGKFDLNAMRNKMQDNLKSAKMKERMREKLKKKKEQEMACGNITKINENKVYLHMMKRLKNLKSDAPNKKKKEKEKKIK